jgi:hypothetical protein
VLGSQALYAAQAYCSDTSIVVCQMDPGNRKTFANLQLLELSNEYEGCRPVYVTPTTWLAKQTKKKASLLGLSNIEIYSMDEISI